MSGKDAYGELENEELRQATLLSQQAYAEENKKVEIRRRIDVLTSPDVRSKVMELRSLVDGLFLDQRVLQ